MLDNVKIEATSSAVLTVTFDGVGAGWEQWLMFRSDAHHDNIMCNRELEKAHLEKALERNALICDFGDLFCAMQGKYDPRSNMDDLRPEDKVTNYLDAIVDHAAEDYRRYAKNWLIFGKGNHETNILKRHGTDLTSNICHRLNVEGGNAIVGGYGGWLRLQFIINKTKSATIKVKYHHGSSKNPDAQVTRGVIQTNRQAVYQPDANIVVNGHSHDAYILPIARERMNDAGTIYRDIIWFLRTPGYKDEYNDGTKGFAIEQGKPPKPLGCIWVKLSRGGSKKCYMDIEVIPGLI